MPMQHVRDSVRGTVLIREAQGVSFLLVRVLEFFQ